MIDAEKPTNVADMPVCPCRTGFFFARGRLGLARHGSRRPRHDPAKSPANALHTTTRMPFRVTPSTTRRAHNKVDSLPTHL